MADQPAPDHVRELMLHTVASERYGTAYNEYPHDHPITRSLREEVEPHVDAVIENFSVLAALMGYTSLKQRREYAVKTPSGGPDAYDLGEFAPFVDLDDAEQHAESRRTRKDAFRDTEAAAVMRFVTVWVPVAAFEETAGE